MKKSVFQMKGLPIITSLEFNLLKDFDLYEKDSLELKMKLGTKIFSKEKNKANVELEVELFPDKKEAPFYAKILSASSFVWEETLSEEKVDELLKTNAPAIILSYMRPIISNITTYAGQAPLVIPLIDLTNEKN